MYYEARSRIIGPCGHHHRTAEAAERCARGMAAIYHRYHPLDARGRYCHVEEVDDNYVHHQIGEDY